MGGIMGFHSAATSSVPANAEKLATSPADLGEDDQSRRTATSPRPEAEARGYSRARKYALLCILCMAQFLDTASGYGTLVTLSEIERGLHLDQPTGTWIMNACTIAFAGFLLLAGRIGDVYNPKYIFVVGLCILGTFTIVAGAAESGIQIILARAIQGVGGALTIPSALKSIVQVFPDDHQQKSALTAFAATGALGCVLSLVIAGLINLVNWRWSFYYIGICSLPLAIAALCIIPAPPPKTKTRANLDVVGLTTMSSALVLLSFGLTNGAISMIWTRASVVAPLVIAFCFCLPAFFWWERRLDPKHALIPPKTWRLPNFTLLFVVTMSNYAWNNGAVLPHTVLWSKPPYNYSPLGIALRFIPIGISSIVLQVWGSFRPAVFENVKRLLWPSLLLAALGSLLMFFGEGLDRYWTFVMPGMLIGSAGNSTAFLVCNIAVMQSGPPAFAGVAGAMFSSALQIGLSITYAILTVIQAVVAARSPVNSFAPTRLQHAFMIGLMLFESMLALVFYRQKVDEKEKEVIVGEC